MGKMCVRCGTKKFFCKTIDHRRGVGDQQSIDVYYTCVLVLHKRQINDANNILCSFEKWFTARTLSMRKNTHKSDLIGDRARWALIYRIIVRGSVRFGWTKKNIETWVCTAQITLLIVLLGVRWMPKQIAPSINSDRYINIMRFNGYF